MTEDRSTGRARARADDDTYWRELGAQGAVPPPELPFSVTCFICGQPGHMAVACKFHPARLRRIAGDACGPGPCSERCRAGDHNDCHPYWCTCACHDLPLPG
jgi:hypothetical protein